MAKQPWMKFYPADWRSDPALRMCSLAARGLWMEMLAIMHEATPRGSLLVNGNPITNQQLAGLAGCGLAEVEILSQELENCGVFSRKKNGVIFSRRIEKDENRARINRENGKLGGNPTFGNDTIKEGPVNPPDKPPVNAQKPEARSHIPERASPSPSRDLFEEAEAALRKIEGLSNHPVAVDPVIAPIWQLVQQGFDLKTQIIPSIGRQLKNRGGKKISRWSYFVAGIIEDSRPSQAIPVVDEEKWNSRLETARKRQQWDTKWGPLPHQSQCLAPKHLLLPNDGDNWIEWKVAA